MSDRWRQHPVLIPDPWLGMAAFLAVLLTVMILLRQYERHRSPRPEVVGKLYHLAGGLVGATSPWLFSDAWPVLTILGVILVTLGALKRISGFRRRLTRILNADPHTSGDLFFALGLAAVFLLSQGDAFYYVVPVVVLTFADAGAALFGSRYGGRRLPLSKSKTFEGTIAFFVVALGVILTGLLLARAASLSTLTVAVLVALGTTAIEAILDGGLDNLFVPVCCSTLLRLLLQPTARAGWLSVIFAFSALLAASRQGSRRPRAAVASGFPNVVRMDK